VKVFQKSTTIRHLTELGLEHRQAQIYLAALELGGGTVLELSRHCGIERTACYYHIEQLLHIELLIKGRRKTNVFFPADPLRLERMIHKKQEALTEVLPDITTLFSTNRGKSTIQYFEGADGIEKLFHEMESVMLAMEETERVYAFSRLFETTDALPDFLIGFFERRRKMAVPSYTILPQSEKPKKDQDKSSDLLISTRYAGGIARKKYLKDQYMPTGMSTVMIARDHIGTVDFKNLFGTLTVSESLAGTWKGLHTYMWDTIKEK
jgi:sugar-specific transcriptional regulator TrmB